MANNEFVGYCTGRVKAFSNVNAIIGFPVTEKGSANNVYALFNDMLYQVSVTIEVARANLFGFLWLPEYKKTYTEAPLVRLFSIESSIIDIFVAGPA